MNQKQRILESAEKLARDIEDSDAFDTLESAIGEAQNPPEHGGHADGSVSEEYFRCASDFRNVIRVARYAVKRLRNL